MVRVFLPASMRALSHGAAILDVPGGTVGTIILALDERFPGLREAVADGDTLRDGLAVSINSELATLGLLEAVPDDAELHFLPAISGGA
jgi:molybdopterin converting factor small subunit